MKTRRQFVALAAGWLAGLGIGSKTVIRLVSLAYAGAQKVVLPRGTDLGSLYNRHPESVDPRNLDIMALEDFGVMGLTEHQTDIDAWRLAIEGNVQTPRRLSYSDLLAMPALQRKVILICPGVFVNLGIWKGVSLHRLLKTAGLKPGVARITVSGPSGKQSKEESFPLEEVASEKIFLAYQVNGKTLPQRHGYPLRVVAEDRYGFEWVKFVDRAVAE